MGVSRAAVVASGLAVLSAVLAALGMWGQVAAKDPGSLAMNLVIVASFPAVAAVVAHHRPEHRIVWVFSIVGMGAAATVFTYGYARYGLETAPGSIPGAVIVGWVAGWVWVGGVMPLVTFGLLLFPDGRLPSRRWWPVAVAAAGIMLMASTHLPPPGTEPGSGSRAARPTVQHLPPPPDRRT